MKNEELVLLIQRGENKKDYLGELYSQNINLLKSICNKYKGLADYEDLLQESFLALWKAAETWKEDRGAIFSSYAYTVIYRELNKYIQNIGTTVDVPANTKYALFRIKQLTDEYLKAYNRKPTAQELAIHMRLTIQQIEQLLRDEYALQIRSTSELILSDNESRTLEDTIRDPHNYYESVDEELDHERLKAVLWGMVDNLPADQAETIRLRYQDGKSVKATAESMNLTPSMVVSHESKAMRTLRISKNRRKLKPYFSESSIYSISMKYSGYNFFMNTHTSGVEKAVMMMLHENQT